ncbi:GDSL-type esterase/lipase family protein [Marinifilum sp. D714]|uniref:GDSL-type esterase/lipase family protein n=1 Tax=Marinifilum sp. D714 TaxID=2937523 RepID=UPI0027D0B352|nr:GDSL-type esterase/lipase family protein [Marinifilum sp. D714]MDQ2179223.1 GDSL-type esterase/lipase family protein [Marinifilum sp. D714]
MEFNPWHTIVIMKIAFLGDSLTYAGRWDDFFPNHEVYNHGVPGEKSNDILMRLPAVLDQKNDQIFLMMGVNDLGDGIESNAIVENFSKLILKVKNETRSNLVIQSLLPVNFEMFPSNVFDSVKIRDINSLLKSLCKEENITFVNLYPSFSTYSNELMKEYTYDGLHLNDAGYRVWKNCLQSEDLI